MDVVLVVEDSKGMQGVLRRLFESGGPNARNSSWIGFIATFVKSGADVQIDFTSMEAMRFIVLGTDFAGQCAPG